MTDHSFIPSAKPPLDKAVKDDATKTPLDLLPFLAIEEVGKVLQFGAKKYARHNWRNGLNWSRLIAASLRHILAWAGGEDNDPESGLSHLAHASFCVLVLLEFVVSKGGTDDRWTPPEPKVFFRVDSGV